MNIPSFNDAANKAPTGIWFRKFETTVIEPLIKKKFLTKEPLSPGLRLSLTLRFLASGDSMKSLHYLYRVGQATVSNIITETTEAIWTTLMPEVLGIPSVEDWANIAKDFDEKSNFPNCVGAIDGKHITVQCFSKTGSKYFNYKGRFSIVLLAICDPQLRFTYVSIGSAGRESDGGIFQSSDIGQLIENRKLPLPPITNLPHTNIPAPFVFVADAGFPLLPNLMRPYPGGNLPPEQTIFNYRLSRARRLIENAFGVLSSRWRIFRRPIHATIDKVENIVKACVVLHNWIREEELSVVAGQRRYMPLRMIDTEDRNGNIEEGGG